MLSQRIILSDSSIIGTLDNWDSFTVAGTGETVVNAIVEKNQNGGIYCLSTSITYGSAGTPKQGRTSEFVAINPAVAGAAGIYCKLGSGTIPKGVVEVLCYNSGNSLLDTLTLVSAFSAPSSYTDKGATINASGGADPAWPAGTAYAKIRVYQQATSAAQDGGIYWDDAYITNGGANLLANPGMGDGLATANTWICNSPPLDVKGQSLNLNVAQVITSGDVLYAQQLGAASSIITLIWTGEKPFSQDDYDGGFSWTALTQTAGTQSFLNIFYNVAVGALNNIYLYRGSTKETVTIISNPADFKPLPKQDNKYAGQIVLRVQYA